MRWSAVSTRSSPPWPPARPPPPRPRASPAIRAPRRAMSLPAEHRLSLNLGDVTEAWRRGSVVASWLLDLTAQALAQDPALESFSGHVSDSGEGRWTVQAAVETAVP